ncbi:MAG: hypothetical protein HKL92_05925 [Candidatus Eremiobacteraeota bacterium]|nr:hypothetical protein [Candidatus Eremiobacteraeota bacterium]NNM92864.1 hypothetical protein [Candidatus Eremiobacteraeota bacterium]
MPGFALPRASRQERAFCATVAVLAAALADPCLEFASNAGWFGAGRFTDRSMADVLPTLLVGLFFLVVQLLLILRRACTRPRLDEALRQPLAALLPSIFMLQLALLFVIESIEQRAVDGHFLGGALWLGAPIPIALAIHALFATGTAFLVATTLREFTRRAPALAAAVRLRREIRSARATSTRRSFAAPFATLSDLVCGSVGERAPPMRVIA